MFQKKEWLRFRATICNMLVTERNYQNWATMRGRARCSLPTGSRPSNHRADPLINPRSRNIRIQFEYEMLFGASNVLLARLSPIFRYTAENWPVGRLSSMRGGFYKRLFSGAVETRMLRLEPPRSSQCLTGL